MLKTRTDKIIKIKAQNKEKRVYIIGHENPCENSPPFSRKYQLSAENHVIWQINVGHAQIYNVRRADCNNDIQHQVWYADFAVFVFQFV